MKRNKYNKINKANLLLENRFILEKVGGDSMINDLTNKVKTLTQQVNNGENLETELQNAISRLILLIKDETIDENTLSEGLYDYAKIALISGFMALGLNNAKAQEKVSDLINISATNKSADIQLSDDIKLEISKTIDSQLSRNKDVKQIVIDLIGKASQVTPPAGLTNQDLASKRAEQAKDFIEAKYGNKVIISTIKTEIGSNKYIRGVDINTDDKFTKEQGVTVKIKAVFGKSLIGEFNSITVIPGKNPDNLVVYNMKGSLITTTGFFGSGEKYHPHYVLMTTMAILKDKNLAPYNEQFKGTLEELKTLMTQSLGKKDDYYNNALRTLTEMYNNNRPIYLYKLTDSVDLDLTGKGNVAINVVTNDKDTNGTVVIKDSNNKPIKCIYDYNGFTFNVL